jgi:hypothetical protein
LACGPGAHAHAGLDEQRPEDAYCGSGAEVSNDHGDYTAHDHGHTGEDE